jgi:hypothetical protein
MIMRLNKQEIAEAVVEYLKRRGVTHLLCELDVHGKIAAVVDDLGYTDFGYTLELSHY